MRINIEIDDGDVLDALTRLRQASRDLTPAMRDIGEALLNSTRERFNTETDPDGNKWADLKDSTKARKPRNKDKILTRDGDLRRELSYREGPDFVEIGSPRVYASTMQFGAEAGAFGATAQGQPIPWGDIPPRAFLGLSDDDRERILEIVLDHFRDA